jgi:proteasome lid subunit RPN8/RPN11
LIGPQEIRAVNGEVASLGLEIVGAYHSHPDVPPRPSTYDREHAWPWYQYLIVSVEGGRAGSMRAWQLTDDRQRFVERPVRIVD